MLNPTPSIDRMPGLLAYYADRLEPQDKTPLLMRKAWLGIVDEPLVKGGKPGDPGLYQKLITDKHGKKVTQWVSLPKGTTAAHNDKQAELFSIHGTPYESLETRPDTTDKQRAVGMDAFTALKRRVNLLRDRGGSAATLLGARLCASFVASGHTELSGQKITSPEDLAALAQVYRDPRFETFRCVFLKGDEVVGESAYTSRLPGSVRLPDDYTRQVEADFKRFGATGYYMLHNHPSGKAKPSKPDERLTEALNRAVPGMKAHVVIDHHEYGLITKEGRVTVVQKPDLAGPDYHASPSLDHPMLGVMIGGPADIALAAKALQSELMSGGPILVMTKGFEARVDLLASVPRAMISTLSDKMPRAKAWLRGVGRATGAGSHAFLIVSDADYIDCRDELRRMIASGLLVDVVSLGGKSIVLNESSMYFGPPLFQDRRPGHKVAESLADDLAAQEKYLADGAKKLGYADIDDLAMNDYPAFERLAVQWRLDHPVETALYQPVATYGGQTETAAFKAWFGSSKITNKDGGPMTLYHGTDKNFESFKVGRGGYSGPAIWLAPQGEFQPTAMGMGSHNNYRDGANVMPVFVKMERPMVIDTKATRDWAVNAFANGDDNFPQLISDRIIREVKDAGYDGIIFKGTKLGWSKHSDEYIVFDPTQIKSAIGNNGGFDGASPIMTKAHPRIIFFKGGKPGGAGLHPELITDKHGKQTTQWVKVAESKPMETDDSNQGGRSADDSTPGAAKQSLREWFGASENVDVDGNPQEFIHSSSESAAPSIDAVKGQFGGIFALKGEDSNYRKFNHAYYVRGLIASTPDLQEHLNSLDDGGRKLINDLSIYTIKDIDAVIDLVLNEGPFDEAGIEAVGGVDVADAFAIMQELRGRVAKSAGFDAVEMEDETGGSYLLLPGDGVRSKASFKNESTAPDSGDNQKAAP